MSMIAVIASLTRGGPPAPPGGGGGGGGGGPVSDIKNPRITPPSVGTSGYRAFGFVEITGLDRATFFYRKGTAHLAGGEIWAVHYTISTDSFGAEFKMFDEPGFDLRDVWGGRMDNDQIILFSAALNVDTASDNYLEMVPFYRKFDLNMNPIGGKVVIVGGSTGVERLWSCSIFGRVSKGDAPGEYYIGLVRLSAGAHAKHACLHTTDYFATFTAHTIYEHPGTGAIGTAAVGGGGVTGVVVSAGGSGFLSPPGVTFTGGGGSGAVATASIDGGGHVTGVVVTNPGTGYTHPPTVDIASSSPQYSETNLQYIGGGKVLAFMRLDFGGSPTLRYSSDYGVTWDYFVLSPSRFGWFGFHERVIYTDIYAGKLNVFFQDRDSGFLAISKDNDPATFLTGGGFNPVEVYHYNPTDTSLFNGLGYPSRIPFATGKWLVAWAKEIDTSNSDIWYTRDDFVTDPSGAPLMVPTLNAAGISSTGAYITLVGYSLDQLNNIRYWSFDLSTDPAFGSFVTAKYLHPGVYPASVIHNTRCEGLFISLDALVAGTTYYLRIKAVNNVGASPYKQITFTTS